MSGYECECYCCQGRYCTVSYIGRSTVSNQYACNDSYCSDNYPLECFRNTTLGGRITYTYNKIQEKASSNDQVEIPTWGRAIIVVVALFLLSFIGIYWRNYNRAEQKGNGRHAQHAPKPKKKNNVTYLYDWGGNDDGGGGGNDGGGGGNDSGGGTVDY